MPAINVSGSRMDAPMLTMFKTSAALAPRRRQGAVAPRLEVISKGPSSPAHAPPILFVHGAWHGAWCWDEFFLDHFAAHGFEAHALSLRAHGASEGGAALHRCRIRHYVDDVAAVAAALPMSPILVGHSMGGFVVQKFLETHSSPSAFLLASIPPSGARSMYARLVRNRPLDVLKANATFSLWPIVSDPDKARRLLFSGATSRDQAVRYHGLMQDESILGFLDCLALDRVAANKVRSPIHVMGAADDAIMTACEIEATARAYGVEPEVFGNVAHDMMLDPNWRMVADAIIRTLDRQFASAPETAPGGERLTADAAPA
jgi:pimeloyl-ACP methyl ester carboxylesterase